MTEESSTISHLSVAVTTNGVNVTQNTRGDAMTSSSSRDYELYFRCALVVIGVVGAAGNALILYAMVASKQHKKHPMIVNQNALDFFCSILLLVSNAVKLCNIRLTGSHGYWLCMTIHNETFIAYGMYGSRINIAAITVERYLKVVHPVWSKNKLRSWMLYSVMAFCWLIGIVVFPPVAMKTLALKNGVCYYIASKKMRTAVMIWYMLSFYVIIFAIFIFCYGRILGAIRRQARVMAAHSAASESGISQARSTQIQTNVIKTMILVSALYVICHLPQAVLYMYIIAGPNSSMQNNYVADVADTSRLIQFLYIITNPFIYGTKFHPVKKILKNTISTCMPCNLTMPHAGA